VGKRFPRVILLRFEPSPFISHNSTPPALLLESDADRVSPHRGDRRPDCGEDDDERNNATSTDCDGYSSYPPAAFRERNTHPGLIPSRYATWPREPTTPTIQVR
jgi:hypothetical protein